MKLLLADYNEGFVTALTQELASQHQIVDVVNDGEAGWTYVTNFEYDLIIWAIALPLLPGISFCQRFRAEGFTTPILLLTTEEVSSSQTVAALDAGADDCVGVTCAFAELSARIRVLTRRNSDNPFPFLAWGELLLNPSTCEVSYDSKPLTLAAKEYELLELLLRDSQHVFSCEEILDHLWSSEEFPVEATVRSHIRRLRKKLQTVGAPSDFIATLHGRGYYLKPPPEEFANLPTTMFSEPQAASSLFSHLHTWDLPHTQLQQDVATVAQLLTAVEANDATPEPRQALYQTVVQIVEALEALDLQAPLRIAQHLEYLLQDAAPQAHYTSLLTTLTTELQMAVNQAAIHSTVADQHSLPSDHAATEPTFQFAPLLLIINPSRVSIDLFNAIAIQQGFRVEQHPSIEIAQAQLTVRSAAAVVLLLGTLSPYQCENLAALTQAHPTLPVVAVGQAHTPSDRLAVIQQGATFFIQPTASLQEEAACYGVLDPIVHLLQTSIRTPKVMIVDRDQAWLRTLPDALQPWDFKVTTLDVSEQFWLILQTIEPDVLLLDTATPSINGLGLCQVLRCDPYWQHLPILALSPFADSQTQHQAFVLGVDDYLHKPIAIADLAQRILSCLRRLQARR